MPSLVALHCLNKCHATAQLGGGAAAGDFLMCVWQATMARAAVRAHAACAIHKGGRAAGSKAAAAAATAAPPAEAAAAAASSQ